MDKDDPELKKVARMPEAEPRLAGRHAFMMAVVLGEENSPEPMPLSTSSPAKAQ